MGGGHSFDRRTFDPAVDKVFIKREDIPDLHMGGGSIYADSMQQPQNVLSGGRQFRNSQYSTGAKNSNVEALYLKSSGVANRQSQKGSYNAAMQVKTRNSGGFSMPFNNQSNSINQKVAVTEEYEKMSPYFMRQSQQQQVMNSQTQQKRKAQ